MSDLYPLRFKPIFRRYLWGGRRLNTLLNKPIDEGPDYAESWEIVDHGKDQSVVESGRLRGHTLAELVQQHNQPMFGRHAGWEQFPLLLKFLDCHRNLSVQVHPDDGAAARLNPPDLGKTEAWVIMHAEAGSRVYAGLKREFDRGAFEREVLRGNTELCLHSFEPTVGDCIFIPAGTVHALGQGLVVAEIQQASDTTYRLYDWNRVDADGNPRPLHVEEGLAAIDYGTGPVSPQVPGTTDDADIQQLVACDKFILQRWSVQGSKTLDVENSFSILAVLEGQVRVAGDPANMPLSKGQSMLLPACAGQVDLVADPAASLLVMRLP